MQRASGILMPVSSLPNDAGIGSLGRCARDFADYVRACGCSYWQVLPLNPTGYGDSPYQSFSTFAGNPYLIDLDELVALGLLKPEELPKFRRGSVDYAKQYREKLKLLRLAHARAGFLREEIQAFSDEHYADWLGDYALFMSIHEEKGTCWQDWERPLRERWDPHMFVVAERHMYDVDFWVFVQYLFFRQLSELRAHLKKIGLKLIGDMPIYVAMDSADAWANQELFRFRRGRPTTVAGVPPDYFCAEGQLWGNPLYRWDVIKRRNYDWWRRRAAHLAGMFDVIRLDHFRGFESFWSVPAGAETAKTGKWERGPGLPFLKALKECGAELIAEDLGIITDEVRALRDRAGFPGMNVLQFAFQSGERSSAYLPHNHQKNSVSYLGTHDNDTALGWFAGLSEADKAYVRAYAGKGNLTEQLFRALFASPSELVVVTMQDVLGYRLGRINTPATASGNWTFRLKDDSYRAETTLLKELNETFSR